MTRYVARAISVSLAMACVARPCVAAEASTGWRSGVQKGWADTKDWSRRHVPSVSLPSKESVVWMLPRVPRWTWSINRPSLPDVTPARVWMESHYPTDAVKKTVSVVVAGERWAVANTPVYGIDMTVAAVAIGASMYGCSKMFSMRKCHLTAPVVAMFAVRHAYAFAGHKGAEDAMAMGGRAGEAFADGGLQDWAFDRAMDALRGD